MVSGLCGRYPDRGAFAHRSGHRRGQDQGGLQFGERRCGHQVIVRDRIPGPLGVHRVCGVCTTTHALASVRAVEDALDIPIPPNAHLIRNIMNEALFVTTMWCIFIICTPSIGSTSSALKADPEGEPDAQSLSRWPKSGVFQRCAEKREDCGGERAIDLFANGYWGHPPTSSRRKSICWRWRLAPGGAGLAEGDRQGARSSAGKTRTPTTWSAGWPPHRHRQRQRSARAVDAFPS